MSNISRRHLLQFTASTLATLGLSQINWLTKADRYGKVLAESTSRKLALLVGINDYLLDPLRGCINDVEMQRHLLIHRFGFNPNDILVVTDKDATRQGILEAFEEHLIKQAKPDDVVVFHYSGHGSLVADPDPIVPNPDGSGVNGTFVPVDGTLPIGYPVEGGAVNDIMGHTLFLLMSAIKSEKFTAVLDCCHAGAATRPDFQVRSRSGGRKIEISAAEKAYQDQWLSKLGWTQEEFVNQYRSSVAKGVVFAATQPNQLAVDANLNGFYSGIFTYLLTQYLWQNEGTPESTIEWIVPQIPERFRQKPTIEVLAESNYKTQSAYFLESANPVADAVVTEANGTTATLWLGGLDIDRLAALEVGVTEFETTGSSGRVTLQSRTGLHAEGMIQGDIQPGTVLRKV
ncbi:MAG: caspase family protein [Geitlerinemataceae cyanobacterium]